MTFNEYSKTKLMSLGPDPSDTWTVDDAMKGISIMGGTGSGKTTASGKTLALKYLKEGWGGLVLCAKTDEAKKWAEYCREAGRSGDMIMFSKGSLYHGKEIIFNPIDYEMNRGGEGGGQTQNIVNIFMNIYRMGNRIAGEGDSKDERFWDTALKRCLSRVIDLINVAGEDLTYRNMVRILSTSDEVDLTKISIGAAEAINGNLNLYDKPEHFCLFCLVKGYMRVKDEPAHTDSSSAYDMAMDYFTYAFKSMGEKVKPTITESFMGLAEPFLSGILNRHFAGSNNLKPELIYTHQKIIILDFPIKEYLDAGIIAQCVFKLMFQQAIERRNVDEFPIPVFLWCDEAQYFINPYDQIFLTTARSSRTSTVYLSQNISNYLAVMGVGANAKARVDSLMGNLSTKIFHANSDAETNGYASRLIGEEIELLAQAGLQRKMFSIEHTHSENLSSSYLPQVRPKEFTVLKSGGELNNFQVESVILVNGRQWSNGKNFIKKTFIQKFQT